MHSPNRMSMLPKLPPTARLAAAGVLLAGLVYFVVFWAPAPPPSRGDVEVVKVEVAVPTLDMAIVNLAKDETREHRLLLEGEPLSHLLAKAIDVVPTVAEALGMSDEPTPLAELRRAPATWRGRWLWYEGEIVDLTGPREGHPVKGRSIYEATLRLASGDHAIAAFSEPPAAGLARGSWARIEGFLLKLRDTNYPISTEQSPLLVGRHIQPDFPDWGPVTAIDRNVLPEVAGNDFWPGSQAWRDLEEDQCEALWHLAAFARDTAPGQTLDDWRKFGTLNVAETYPLLQRNQFAPGTPLRILGTLVKRTTLAAPSNPAGIKHWTKVWLQVRDFAGHVIPVWVPRRAEELPLRTDLEVRGYYYRWLVYEAMDGKRYHMPLFVAADLDRFDLGTGKMTTALSLGMAGMVLCLAVGILVVKRRWERASVAHEKELDERRRRRREKAPSSDAATADSTS